MVNSNTVSLTLIACRATQLRFVNVETLSNNAINELGNHTNVNNTIHEHSIMCKDAF